ncbi:GNAT family N-acetyltransferase [Glycomyces paridis]|uniref:GNAT family N-acetyltransferase n=1 Tax=Glycomyces paridis TaxID=2126555 RepID=A0A4S8P0X6_9ACTN|nr:GNAT family N-acetyltransferase [Glycomyces paridis]
MTRSTPLHLRPWRTGDFGAVLEALASPDMDRQFPSGETAEARAEQWLGWATGLIARPAGFAFAVCADDDEPLANLAATAIDRHDVGWVSYWTTCRARGLGIAADALAALVPWLHDEAGVWRLELGHRLNNPASGRIAERAGFLREGVERAKLKYEGRRYDTARWARLADDPRPKARRTVEL